MLNIIYGASGSGKQRFGEIIENVPYFSLVPKGTNREQREYDGDTLYFFTSEEELKKECKYVYSYQKDEGEDPQYYFGIRESDIETAVRDNRNYFLFCNDLRTIVKLDREFINVRTFLFQVDDCEELYRLSTEKNPEARAKRLRDLYAQVMQDDMLRIFDGIIFYRVKAGLQKQQAIVDVRRQLFSLLETNACCMEYEAAVSKVIAVMMPQGERGYEKLHFNKVFKTIERVARINGYEAVRVVESRDDIISRIYDTIFTAKIVIVDLSLARPNCYFEAGLASGCGKKHILYICDHKTQIEFNLSNRDVPKYDCDNNRGDLERIIKGYIRRVEGETS